MTNALEPIAPPTNGVGLTRAVKTVDLMSKADKAREFNEGPIGYV
jgi:hypothetical protein